MIKDSQKLKDLFLSIGYTEKEYEKIINNSSLEKYNEETLYQKVELIYGYLINLKYSPKNIIKMSIKHPKIFEYTIDNITQKIKYLMELGYKIEDIIKMTITLPQIFSLSLNNITQKIKYLMELGYKIEDIIKMTINHSQIFEYTIDNITQKIKEVMSLGYTKDEVIKMTISLPQIYSYSVEKNMKQKIQDLMKLGYTKEEVIKMTIDLPQIYSSSIENIRGKIEFYDSINMHELAIIDTKRLMQSTALSYARYMFYKERGIDININNYRKIFIGQIQFKKSYEITNQELLEMYSYDKYLEETKNGRTI